MREEEQVDLLSGARRVGVSVDEAMIERIDAFIDLLTLWNQRFHLTGDRDRRILVRKHVVDSLAVVPELPAAGPVIDLGSGAGFPGIVLGCARPGVTLWLIEPRRRPSSFLSEAVRTIPLPAARVLELRAEDAARDPSIGRHATLVVARAVRLDVLLPLALPLLAPEGCLVAMQGRPVDERRIRARAHTFGADLRSARGYELPDGEVRQLLTFGHR